MKKIVKEFNNLIKNTISKNKNKRIINFKISSFSKYLIIFIGLLFLYIFYLLTPLLYEKSWVQNNIESKLFNEFGINLSASADISYRILPAPHFLIKDSKILIEDDAKIKSIAEIKDLRIFLSQKQFFDKKKMNITKVIINKANFSLLTADYKLLNESINKQFSNKKVKINDSKIFFKNNFSDVITIVKIHKAALFFDDEKLLNLFSLKGEVFTVPFAFDFSSEKNYKRKKEINFKAKSIKLNIFNKFIQEKDNSITGENIISFFKSKVNTEYNAQNDLIIFKSKNSKKKNSTYDYNGELSVDPFDLVFNINLKKDKITKLFNINPLLSEFVKSELLFNENISIKISIAADSNKKNEIFQNAKIIFNIINGKLNFDNTRLVNNEIGSVKLNNSNLFLENNRLILNTDMFIDIKNSDALFSFLSTSKKSRKDIKNILINLDYDHSNNQIKFNNIKIDNNSVENNILEIIDNFSDNEFNNLNKSRRLLNELLSAYEG